MFDCKDMSILCGMYLKDKGYDVEAVVGKINQEAHMWLAVKGKAGDGYEFVECTADPLNRMGQVVDDDHYKTGLVSDDPHMLELAEGWSITGEYSLDEVVDN